MNTYNAGEVSVIVGSRVLTGLAEGSFVNVTRNEDPFTDPQIGVRGEATRSKTNNKSGTIEITLQQHSPDNAYLQQLVNTDENTGQGIVPVKIMDQSGTFVAIGTESYIKKPADMDFSRDAGERTWTIAVPNLDLSGGGA